MFMTVLEMDRDDIDSIYNITSVLCELEEFDTAYNLIKNSSKKYRVKVTYKIYFILLREEI